MFNLAKILCSGTNVPEICRMATLSTTAYKVGCALTVSGGKVVNATATDKPLYIAAESAAAGEKAYIKCYPVLNNMIFEAPVANAPYTIQTGSKIVLALTDGFADKVGSSTTDGVATVVDTKGAMMPGDKILVKFE